MALVGKDSSPSGLAVELSKAKERYEAARSSIIERAHKRVEQLKHLAAEIDSEIKDHLTVLDSTKSPAE